MHEQATDCPFGWGNRKSEHCNISVAITKTEKEVLPRDVKLPCKEPSYEPMRLTSQYVPYSLCAWSAEQVGLLL